MSASRALSAFTRSARLAAVTKCHPSSELATAGVSLPQVTGELTTDETLEGGSISATMSQNREDSGTAYRLTPDD